MNVEACIIQKTKEMNIGLIAVDSDYPNLALMKISSYHKRGGGFGRVVHSL